MAKPIEEHKYLKLLRMVGWSLENGSIDYNLLNEKGLRLCSIKIIHAKGKKREVSAYSVRETEKRFKEKGLEWPPKKKLKII